MTTHIMLIAGEVSGDLLGGAMMVQLKGEAEGDIVFSGVGGEAMIAAGLESLLPLEAVSSGGFVDVILRAPVLLWRIRKMAKEIVRRSPAALVIIDSYDFTHRVARTVKRRAPEIEIINYAPPKVWVWRSGRAKKIKKYITRCLAIFPFEVEAFAELQGPETVYIGHPALERIASQSEGQAFREKYGIGNQQKIVILAPGSRPLEIKHLAQIFSEAAELLAERFDIQFVIPVAPTIHGLLRQSWPFKPLLIDREDEKRAAFRAADAALAASGTVTMELALSNTPFVCAYRLTRIEEWIFARLVNLDMISPANLILGRRAFPEFLGKAVQPLALADAMSALLSGKADHSDDLAELQRKSQTPQLPSLMAAHSVLEIISD